MIGFNRRFDPNFAALERRLRQREAGEIEIVNVISRDPGPPPLDYVKRSGGLFRAAAYRAELAAFITACAGKAAPSPTGLEGLRAQMLADAATESARTGRPVATKAACS
jgi:predicted dehydrogenase